MLSEEQEQAMLIKWFDHWAANEFKFRLFAVPNGGLRNAIVAKKLKGQGVRAGVPDLFFLVQRGQFHGLVIEMKREKGGRLSPEQAAWLDWLTEHGYMAVVCCGFEAAKKTIIDYLRIQK